MLLFLDYYLKTLIDHISQLRQCLTEIAIILIIAVAIDELSAKFRIGLTPTREAAGPIIIFATNRMHGGEFGMTHPIPDDARLFELF